MIFDFGQDKMSLFGIDFAENTLPFLHNPNPGSLKCKLVSA